jgi:hypothetical protein
MNTASGLTQLISTDEQTEAAVEGHTLGCIEWALEEITEEAAAAGVILVGDIVETYRGEALAELARRRCEIDCNC